MSEKAEHERKFTEKEFAAILKRAGELQKKHLDNPDNAAGLTAADIRKIAEESCIGLDHVEQAIAEVEAGAPGKGAGIWGKLTGGPGLIELRRELPSAFPKERYDDLLAVIRRALGTDGRSSVTGNTLSWERVNAATAETLAVAVSPRGQRTTLELRADLRNPKAAVFGGILGGVGGGAGLGVGLSLGLAVLHSLLFPALFIPGMFIAAFLLARTIWKSIVKREKRKLEKLMKELGETASAP